MRPAKSSLVACVSQGYFVRARRVSVTSKSANGVNEPRTADCLSRVLTASYRAVSSANGDTLGCSERRS